MCACVQLRHNSLLQLLLAVSLHFHLFGSLYSALSSVVLFSLFTDAAAMCSFVGPLSASLSPFVRHYIIRQQQKRKILRAKGNHPVPDGIVNDALQIHLYIIHETWPRHRRQSDQCRRDFGLRRPLTNRSLPSTQLYCVS